MKKVLYLFFWVFIIISCKNIPQANKAIESGVSLEMATYRASQISNVHYNLNFQIPEEQKNPIHSKLILDFNLEQLQESVYLDFKEETSKIKSVAINDNCVGIKHINEHIFLSKDHLKNGRNSVTIEFIAGELSLNRNKNYLYTLLVPDRARTLFPCFDQPNIKGTYTLSITAPKDWKVLCGAKEANKIEQGAYTKHEFGESDRMSTYLFSFVAGKFESVTKKPWK